MTRAEFDQDAFEADFIFGPRRRERFAYFVAAAGVIVGVQDGFGSAGVFAALFLISAVLSTTSNNGAAAVILAPVAWKVAAGCLG